MAEKIESSLAQRRSLDKAFRQQLEEKRPLEKYKLNYVNPDFPILSFTFAVMAGGEDVFYCDHTAAYAKRYLGYDFATKKQDPAYRLPSARREALFSVLGRLDAERERDPLSSPYPTREEWKLVMDQLLEELADPNAPRPEPLW
jgi:hypothetical protein